MSQFNLAHFLQNPGDGRALLRFVNRDTVFCEGNSANAMFHVLVGEVNLTVTSLEGEERVLATVGQGGLFGEGCLISGQSRTHSASATMPSIIMRLDREMLLETAVREPALMEVIVSHVLNRTVRLEQHFLSEACGLSPALSETEHESRKGTLSEGSQQAVSHVCR